MKFLLLILPVVRIAAAQNSTSCKVTPSDAQWPSPQDWATFNATVNGALIKTAPIASTCFRNNPFNIKTQCADVTEQWENATFHRMLPESIDFPIFTNRACVPSSKTGGSTLGGACTVGAYPAYVVKATNVVQIATALTWASQKNIRVVIKGTGHDLSGRSTGAHSLSIWTYSLQGIVYDNQWKPDGSTANTTYEAMKIGSGMTWGEVYKAADEVDRAVVGAGTSTVGVGGHILGGGYGPLSFEKGLASDNVLQATVVTPTGKVLVANEFKNTDLFWAIRGGGPGVYGVVTEFVLQTYPTPQVSSAAFQFQAASSTVADNADAALKAAGIIASYINDWMDKGISGTMYTATGQTIKEIVKNIDVAAMLFGAGPVTYFKVHAFNTTPQKLNDTIHQAIQLAERAYIGKLATKYPIPRVYGSFYSWFSQNEEPVAVGYERVQSSRLLTRSNLSGNNLARMINRILTPKNSITGSSLALHMVSGKGPATVSASQQGGLTSAWRRAQVHAVANTAVPDGLTTWSANQALEDAGKWINENTERSWDAWAPNTGAYLNEANQYNPKWKELFYGDKYDRLWEIKQKYDPQDTLFVEQGVGSHRWKYDMTSGKLCRT